MEEHYDINESASTLSHEHLTEMKVFMGETSEQFREFEDAVCDSVSEVWDSARDPVSLVKQPFEARRVQDLFSSDNKPFDKVMTVFAYLCWEIRALRKVAREKYFGPLALFGESADRGDDGEEDLPEGELQLQASRLISLLQDIKNFVRRAYDVGRNLVQQLANLYKGDRTRGHITSFQGVYVATIYDHLADLMSMLISLDELIDKNENISDCWTRYKRMLKTVSADAERYGSDEVTLEKFEQYLIIFEDEVLDGRIFPGFIDQEFTLPGTINISSNKEFMVELYDNILKMTKTTSDLFEDKLRVSRRSVKQGHEVIGLFGLFILHCRLSRAMPDKKLYKELYYMYRKLPMVTVFGKTVFSPQQLLTSLVPPPPATIQLKDLVQEHRAYVKQIDDDLGNIAMSLHGQVTSWMVQLESSMSAMVRGVRLYKYSLHTGDLLVKGVLMAQSTGFLLRNLMNMHLELELGLKPSAVRAIGGLCQLLQALKASFSRRSSQVALRLTLVTRHISRFLSDKLVPMRARLEKSLIDNRGFKSKKAEGSIVDMLSAVRLMMNLLDGCVTHERMLVLNQTWELFAPKAKELAGQDTLRAFDEQLWKLSILVDHVRLLDEACDCSFLYFSPHLIPAILEHVYKTPHLASTLPYLVAACMDAGPLLMTQQHLSDKDALFNGYKAELLITLEEELVTPLCTDTENDLRVHIHSSIIVQEMEQYNPVKRGVKDLTRFFKLGPLSVFDTSLSLKNRVSHYLNRTFYNLTTVALHNWMTYGEMRNLAKEKFGLELTDGHLPGQTLQQGLDVLEIMRNIHIFVSRYDYNQNNQLFIEHDTEGRHLNTINIQHITNSIRTHGIGMMNTTVNYTYQFLMQKFMIFSQFLFDDNISSKLIKDARFYKMNKDQLDSKYPYERAEKFIKAVRKLGLVGSMTYLDQFRKLVTEIGNALGYVRMIRSGGLRFSANAIKFVPDVTDVTKFKDPAEEAKLADSTATAASQLDDLLETLGEAAGEGANYFRIMVEAFSELRSADNAHLKYFYAIIPAMMINFVDHMLIEKDKLQKKGKFGAISEDGFAIGVAYILAVLKLDKRFDSLHWFDSVRAEFNSREQEVTQHLQQRRGGDEDAQHTLKLRKTKAHKGEFEMLYYAFNGARIFFRDETNFKRNEVVKEDLSAAPEPAAAAGDAAAAAGI